MISNFCKHLKGNGQTAFSFIKTDNGRFSTCTKQALVLGIETSCDDTGCAVVDGTGKILGEALYSQTAIHTKFGGVNPLMAFELHRNNIEAAVHDALSKAQISIDDVDAIAVTVKPGLLVSLQVGVKYARYIARKHSKPLVPVHHMEAHALVARMYHDIPFPFLVLLISGGHCLLSLVRDVNDFILLGKSLDNAPGEILDKVARRMKLKNITEFSKISGGRAIELAARMARNPDSFQFTLPLLRNRDCNFSFSGLKDALVRKLVKKETEHGLKGDEIIPEVNDLCAAFQGAITEHLIHRTHRAILYCENVGLISPNNGRIVISGGVACNDYIYKAIEVFTDKLGYSAFRPPSQVCTDNGIMIAWNGLEKLRLNLDIKSDIELHDVEPVAPLGKSIIEQVAAANIKTKITRLKNVCKF